MKLKSKPPTREDLNEAKDLATKWARTRLSEPTRTLIIDTETTGILSKDPDTEICQITIINVFGRPVLNMLLKPSKPITLELTKIHGIDQQMVLQSPTFAQVAEILCDIIEGKHLVAYNASFDIHLIVHLLTKYGFQVPEFDTSCCMEEYARWCGEWSSQKGDWKWQKLPKLAYGSAHDSFTDALSTLMLMKKMVGDFSDEPAPEDIDLDF